MPIPDYWTWTKTTPQKKWFFLSSPYEIEVMTTSLTEMLELPNFGHVAISTIKFVSHGQMLWYYKLYFKKPSVAIFAEIIKIVIMFIKTIFKDLKEVKILRNYIPIFSIYLYFLI